MPNSEHKMYRSPASLAFLLSEVMCPPDKNALSHYKDTCRERERLAAVYSTAADMLLSGAISLIHPFLRPACRGFRELLSRRYSYTQATGDRSTIFERRDELPAMGRSDQFRVGSFHFCYRPSRPDLLSSIYDQLQKQLRLLLRHGWTLQQDRLRRDKLKSAPSFWPVHRIENLSVLLLIMVKRTWGYTIDLSMNATCSHFQQRSTNPVNIGRGPHCRKRAPCLLFAPAVKISPDNL